MKDNKLDSKRDTEARRNAKRARYFKKKEQLIDAWAATHAIRIAEIITDKPITEVNIERVKDYIKANLKIKISGN